MLIHQATAQFELFTGQEAPTEVMARAAYGALGPKAVGAGLKPAPTIDLKKCRAGTARLLLTMMVGSAHPTF